MGIHSLLTSTEIVELLEIIHETASCLDINHLKKIVIRVGQLFAFEKIVFAFPQGSGHTAPIDAINISYPLEWLNLYRTKEFWKIDPVVVEACSSGKGTFFWSDVYQRRPPCETFVGLANDFGLAEGCTCVTTTNGVKGQWSMVSVGGGGLRQDPRAAYILERLHPHFHIFFTSRKKNDFQQLLQRLTTREAEVLQWVQNGKTSWEISVILKIAESTVNFHVGNIKQKLDVSSRSQAVAIAIHGGLIGLD